MSKPVTLEIQIDPETLNYLVAPGEELYIPVPEESYPEIERMLEAFVKEISDKFGFTRAQMFTDLL